MPSVEAERVLAELVAAKGAPKPPINQLRREWTARTEGDVLPEGTRTRAVKAGGVLAEWVEAPGVQTDAAFLFIHGGGFCAGGPITHRKLAAYLSRATGMRVLVPDYRLAPEHPFPAGVQDCLAVYGALLSDGIAARRIAIGGDSAGGGMAGSVVLSLREGGAPLPSSVTMLSPWLDLTNSGASYKTNAEHDPTITLERHNEIAPWYYGEADPRNPILSPLFANLRGFPPVFLQVGDIEVMADDSRMFAERAKKAGVRAELEIWPRLWHVWHHRAPDVPEALQAFEKIGAFVRKNLGS